MSTFWRYVRAQLFVLLCGIVGPIFLGIYFVAGADPIMQWMLWAGLLITAVDVVIAVAIIAFGANKAAKTKALEASRSVGPGPRVRTGDHPVLDAGSCGRVGEPAADDHQPQTRRPDGSGDQRIPLRHRRCPPPRPTRPHPPKPLLHNGFSSWKRCAPPVPSPRPSTPPNASRSSPTSNRPTLERVLVLLLA